MEPCTQPGERITFGIQSQNGLEFQRCNILRDIQAGRFRGKITFWGEIDRQHVLPFGTPDEVRAAVKRVRTALDDPKGGVIAQFEMGKDVSVENALAVLEAWEVERE